MSAPLAVEAIGAGWLAEQVAGWADEVKHVTPVAFAEAHRYLPASVTSLPGRISFDVNPFMREIVECFDVRSPVREVTVMKGVQITATTALESGLLYYIGHVRTLPVLYVTADLGLSQQRVEHNFLPMLQQSGFSHVVQSHDAGNSRKTGSTVKHIQWAGGGYLVPFGAKVADKFRQQSYCVLLCDEMDAWPDVVGKDGDPVQLVDDRASGYYDRRKIFRISTPLIKGSSKIDAAYERGDKREYRVLCKHCEYPQALRWQAVNKETGVVGGFIWETEGGMLIAESVRYCCQECGGQHAEHDKERLFSESHGAHWHPTKKPDEEHLRSYHLPALYSPIGMQPWSKVAAVWLKAWDPEVKEVRDVGKLQVFYNNMLGVPFQVRGARVQFVQVSAHRRTEYRFGEVPNRYAAEHSGSCIQILTCQVDVHKRNLAVAVTGWTVGARCYLIDYWRFEALEGEPDCDAEDCPVWARLAELIDEKEYVADDGKRYRIELTLIDAGYSSSRVALFCGQYAAGVFPVIGADTIQRSQAIREFGEYEMQSGERGYRVIVNFYKDRLAPVLRRDWVPELGAQGRYHFNAPTDVTNEQLKELTREHREEQTDPRTGKVRHAWVKHGSRNELWDLLVYGLAAIDILAVNTCREVHGKDSVDWTWFWRYVQDAKPYYVDR
jgi:phage terminase large subunit GpA-like protein